MIRVDVDLTAFNTLRLSSRAEYFAEPGTIEQLHTCLQFARDQELPVTVLGSGSNVVLKPLIPGLVLVPSLLGREVIQRDVGFSLVRLAASENWDQAVLWCLQQGFAGIENLSLIPGTCGAAPIQNIGAYGVELADVLYSVTALHRVTGELKVFSRELCEFGYRDSIFKTGQQNQWLVLDIVLRFDHQADFCLRYADLETRFRALPDDEQDAVGLREIIIALRQSKLPDPESLPNAGSFFKNPVVSVEKAGQLRALFTTLVSYPAESGQVKLAAGWLIEQAGWKGRWLGNVGMHEKQALVLVNKGEPNAEVLLAVASQVRSDVMERFGVLLEQEPLILPA